MLLSPVEDMLAAGMESPFVEVDEAPSVLLLLSSLLDLQSCFFM